MLGDVVFVRVGGTDDEPLLRPARVVHVWSSDILNLNVYLNGIEDQRAPHCYATPEEVAYGCMAHRTSVSRGTAFGQWRPR